MSKPPPPPASAPPTAATSKPTQTQPPKPPKQKQTQNQPQKSTKPPKAKPTYTLTPRGSRPTGPNAHLSLRLSHLYRAASATLTPDPSAATSHLSRLYVGTLRSVAKKNVLRLAPELKRTLCKRCDAVLVPGVTAETRRENKSKGGRKGWAEVVVVECRACGGVKRFAVGMEGFVRREKKGAGKGSEGAGQVGAEHGTEGKDGEDGKMVAAAGEGGVEKQETKAVATTAGELEPQDAKTIVIDSHTTESIDIEMQDPNH